MTGMRFIIRRVEAVRTLIRDRAGAVMVEFALALPLLLLLLAGGYELGRAIWHHHLVDKGVRDATRYLTRVPNPTDAASIERARRLLVAGSFDAAATPVLADWVLDPSLVQVAVQLQTLDNSLGEFRGPDGGVANIDVVKLTATVQYNGVGLLPFIGFADGMTMVVSHEERHIGE